MSLKKFKLLVLVSCGLIAGCGEVLEFFKPEEPPRNRQIYAIYKRIALKQSTSADVLAAFGTPKNALLSQSKSIIVLAGEKKKGYKMWFDMVTFDENELIAKRKYVFISDERPKQLFVEPWAGVDFDCKTVLPKKILDEPYANENSRRIAILKQIAADTRKDTSEVGADNKDVELGGIIIGQAMETLAVKLDESPAQASRLTDPNGLWFSHVSYDRGLLRMVVDGDVASVKMRLGSFAKGVKITFEGYVEGD